jgi:DNA primase
MTPFKKRADQLFGPCPVHGGDNPNAFVISLSKNIWHCFTRCNTGGDVIKLVRRLYGKDYRQTAAFLSSLAHTAATSPSVCSAHYRKQPFTPFTARLPLDASTPWLLKKQINPATASRFETGAYHAKGFLSGCIAVRLHDLTGHPIGYAARQLNPHLAKQYGKWKFPAGFPKNEIFYNFHRIRSANPKAVVVVECPWAVMRLAQLNVPAVALLGIHLSPLQLDILKKLPRVVLMLDGDYAGRSATVRVRNTLQPYTKVHCITLPSDLDPDDLTDNALLSATNHFFL